MGEIRGMVVLTDPPHVRIAAEAAYARAMEALAADLATYLASAEHYPAENGRQAVVLFLERLAELPLQPFIEGFALTGEEADQAMSLALDCIGQSVQLIHAAALVRP